jgi:hypothetical protein
MDGMYLVLPWFLALAFLAFVSFVGALIILWSFISRSDDLKLRKWGYSLFLAPIFVVVVFIIYLYFTIAK